MSDGRRDFLVFCLDDNLLGLALNEVERVYPRVELENPIRKPVEMLGIFQVGNRRLPVLDIRGFMNLPVRSPALDDILIEVVSRGSRFAFPADGLVGTCSFVPEELRECTAVCPGMAGYVNQVAEFEGRTVWIYTLERLFVSHDFPGILVRCRDAVQQADEEVVE